jgi:hypothetical protein
MDRFRKGELARHVLQPRLWLRRMYSDATRNLRSLNAHYSAHNVRKQRRPPNNNNNNNNENNNNAGEEKRETSDVQLWRHVELARPLNDTAQLSAPEHASSFATMTLRQRGLPSFVPPMLLIADSTTLYAAPLLYRKVKID